MTLDASYGKEHVPFVWLFTFGVAMGFLEAIVVVYLRELYYPFGFSFPLAPIPPRILYAEMLRELTTILMLFALAMASARGMYLRLSVFLYTFGIWDIFYYVALKTLLGWPPSLLSWDILFLIPVAWSGPVIAPVINALTMIALALLIPFILKRHGSVSFGPGGWGLLMLGALLILTAYIWNYAGLIIQGGFMREYLNLPYNAEFQRAVAGYVPRRFSWSLYGAGQALLLYAMFHIHRRSVRMRRY